MTTFAPRRRENGHFTPGDNGRLGYRARVCRRGHPMQGPGSDVLIQGTQRRCRRCSRIADANRRGTPSDTHGRALHCRGPARHLRTAENTAIIGNQRHCLECRPRVDRIDNALLREIAERQHARGVTWAELARAAGMVANNGKPDTSHLRRSLGIRWESSISKGKQYRRYRSRINVDLAERIMRALDADPFEVGL